MLARFFQIEEIPEEKRGLLYGFAFLVAWDTLTFGMLSTYLILYIIDELGFAQFGIIIAIKLAVQTLLDYPSGALGDYIGQQRVMIIAFISYIGALTSLYIASGFVGFLIGYVFFGVANSQESGALSSWLANRYQPIKESIDPERQIFGAFDGRIDTMRFAVLFGSIILGGFLSDQFGRRSIILISLGGVLIMLFAIFAIMKQTDVEISRISEKIFSIRDFLGEVPKGLNFMLSSRSIVLFYLGSAIMISAIGNIYAELILYPLFFRYSLNDTRTGIMRASIFFFGIFWGLIMSKWSKSIANEKFLLLATRIINSVMFFFILYFFLIYFPPPVTFSPILFVGLIALFQIRIMFGSLPRLLFNRIQLELVPSDIRNAVYSLIPTMITLFGIPFSLVGGFIITKFELSGGLLTVGGLACFGLILFAIGLRELDYKQN